MELQVVKGDITSMKVDAVVLPANTALKEGSGASQAIFEKAGRKELTAACKQLAPVEVGSAIATPAYNLSAQYILHAVVPKWQGGGKNEYALLSSAYLSCLSVADAMGCESIAFPLLAAGNNGFNMKLAAKIAQESILNYTAGNTLKTVFLVVYNEAAKVIMVGMGIPVAPTIPAGYYTHIVMHRSNTALAEKKEDSPGFFSKVADFSKNFWIKHKHQLVAGGALFAQAVVLKKAVPKAELLNLGLGIVKDEILR